MFDTLNAEQPLSLPNELTTDIFIHAISVDLDTIPYNGPSTPLTTPLVLGAVCSSWRSFVWETPPLWRVIVLKLTYEQYDDQMDILDLFLERSGSYPLEFYFRSVYNMDQPAMHDESFSVAAFRKLVSQSMRWKRISICVLDNMGFIELLREVTGKIPLLETGIVHMERTGIDTLHMFEDAPLLNRFSISKLDIDYILLPWAQLTSFDVDGFGEFTEQSCLLVLSLCTNLVECSFYYVAETFYRHLTGEVILLLHLRSLSITGTSTKTLEIILGSIQCPALRQLHLSSEEFGRDVGLSGPRVEDFINRSNCILEVLNLGGLRSQFPIIPILERLPSLQTLILGASRYYNDTVHSDNPGANSFFLALLERLEITTTGTSILPDLAELQFKIPLDYSPTNFSSFLTSPNFLYISKDRSETAQEVIYHICLDSIEDISFRLISYDLELE